METIETVAVLGASERGTACAVLAALAGCAVRVLDAGHALAAGADAVRRRVARALAQGAISADERQRILDSILFTADDDEALTGADLVVDASTAEGPAAPGLGESLRATAAIVAAGAAPAAELAARVPQPGRVLALRLADADAAVPQVEILAAAATSAHVLARARSFAARLNRATHLPTLTPVP